jgi:hypothetical protein
MPVKRPKARLLVGYILMRGNFIAGSRTLKEKEGRARPVAGHR